MRSAPLRSTVVGLALVAGFLPVRTAYAQQTPAIEIALTRQRVRGQTPEVHVAIPSREVFQGAEVSPAAGVTVAGVGNLKKSELSQNVAWWDVTINVAPDAAPGPRSLVLLMPDGRTTAATLVIT